MRRLLLVMVVMLVAAAAPAQESPARPADGDLVVATVNGERITRARFEALWSGLSAATRAQYEEAEGGRLAFLDTVIRRRLILQDAVAQGYDRWPEVTSKPESEREAALFDLYVREMIAPRVVGDEAVEAFYASNPERFRMPARVKLRIIAISTARRMPAEARQLLSGISVELFSLRPKVAAAGDPAILVEAFARAAAEHSEHPSGAAGGDLGWVDPDKLDAKLAEAAKMVPEMMVSGILETQSGVALLLVEKRSEPTLVAYESARDAIREHLLSRSSREIVAAAAMHAATLRDAADLRVFPRNLR